MHHPTDRIIHITAFVTPVVEYWLEREIAQWALQEMNTTQLLTKLLNLAGTRNSSMDPRHEASIRRPIAP